MEKITRALITGVNGFVGTFLAKELHNHGYEVFGTGRETDSRITSLAYRRLDVTDPDEAVALFQEIRPTHVFHLAGIGSPGAAEKDRAGTFRIHVDGTKHILDASLALTAPPRVLIVSSGNVYGTPQYLPLNESHPRRGTGVYAESRIAQEDIVQAYFNKLPVIIVRSFNHTGAGQPADYVFSKIVKNVVEIAAGVRQELVMGNIGLKRECLHVSDVVRAYRLLLEQDQMGIMVNVCRGQAVALKDVIEYSRVLAGLTHVPVVLDPAFAGKKEIQEIVGDPALLSSLIAWETAYDFKAIVKDLYDYWRGQLA